MQKHLDQENNITRKNAKKSNGINIPGGEQVKSDTRR